MNTTISNPYIGPRTFSREERHLFFGRDREARDLTALVVTERLVLFYAQSGAGKSSLINTCLIPELAENLYEILPVARVSGDAPEGIEVDNIYVYNLMRSLIRREIVPGSLAHLSLPQFMGRLNEDENGYFYDAGLQTELRGAAQEISWRRALIIDQFEELFTTHQGAWKKREGFFKQLAQAMQDDPDLWVILVMREDYIAALDPYAHLVAGGLRTRYYMQRLSREAAIKAVKSPAEKLRPYAEGVAEHLVENLASVKAQSPDGKLVIQPGQYVEPVQLQVVCYGLWENLPPGKTPITEKEAREVGDVDHALEQYYDKRVRTVAEEEKISQRPIREWFDKQLITSSGTRNLVLRESVRDLSDDVIRALEGGLIRAEMRAGQLWYELSHDRLIEPVRKNNDEWFKQNLSVFQRQAELWKDQGRSEGLLLRDKELEDAEQEAATLVLTTDEQEFLEECRQLRTRELRDQRQRRGIFAALVVAVLLFFVAVYFAFNASQASAALEVSFQQAQIARDNALNAEEVAVQAQQRAEEARQEAELAKEDAELQANRALAGSLAAQANSIKNSQHALALLLGMEAYQRDPNSPLTRTTLFQLLQFTPYARLSGFDGSVSSIAISPDGSLIATASCTIDDNQQCRRGQITLFDEKLGLIEPLSEEYGIVYSMAFYEYDNLLVLAAGGCVPQGCSEGRGQITFWKINDDRTVDLITQKSDHFALVKTVAFSPDGTVLASGSYDSTILLWNMSNPANPLRGERLDHESFVNSIAFSRDGNILASAGDDKTIYVWNFSQTEAPLAKQRTHNASVASVAFSPDGKKLASAGDDNKIFLWDWDPESGTLQQTDALSGHTGYVKSVAFNSDGTLLASAGFDNRIILWDTSTGEQTGLPLSVHTKAINAVAFGIGSSENGNYPYLLSAGDDRTVIKWDLSTRNPLSRVLKVEPQGDGQLESNEEYEARIDGRQIDLQNKKTAESKYLSGYTARVNSVSFNRQPIDERDLLSSASDDQTVIIYDVTDFSQLSEFLKLEGFDTPVDKVYFDGTWLITIDKNGSVIQWTIDPANWLQLACDSVKPNLTAEDRQKFFNDLKGLSGQSAQTCITNP